MKIITTAISIICLMFFTGCEALKYKKVSAKDFPPDPKERIKKNMEVKENAFLFRSSRKPRGYAQWNK